ncbi:uroplakin-3b-like isoform X2 [Conger conger]|uniref:uroplakin-3b-like isoform X2 n=1 Tax=Conger conger TaxID=82655 RepID=UPI002A5A29B7|nr:uroplakin-3b-like isoform X2 [Conger conger]
MAFSYIAAICTLLCCVRSKILSVGQVPHILPHEVIGRVTSTSFVLSQPLCYFNHQTELPCTVNTCEIWSVIASGPGVHNFDRDKVRVASGILSASPYMDAFLGQGQKMYFITKLGVPRNFPCGDLPGIRYFKVGADGNCSTTNCNGILPAGSTVRVKYILIDPVTKKVVSESKWSFPIILLTSRASSSIDESMWKRSGAMVVITVILSCSLAVLALLLAIVLLLDCVGSGRGRHDIITDAASFRAQSYSTSGTYALRP